MQRKATLFVNKENRLPNDHQEALKEAYKEGLADALELPKKATNQEVGKEQAIRSIAKKREETKQQLHLIEKRHAIELLHVHSVFPFSIFPDTLIIDTTKITVVRKQFFATEYITTIPLKDLSDVTIQTVLFLFA